MASRVLQGIGVLAILALAGASTATLLLLRQRVHVTIAAEEEAARRGPDPIEVLRADIGALAEEMDGVTAGLGPAFQEMHDVLQGSADRETALMARVDALEARLAALQESAARNDAAVAASLRALSEALERLGAGGAAGEVDLQAPPVAEGPDVEEGVAPPSPPATPEASPRKAFLGFQVPSGTLVFDRRQRFAIVPALSRVGFDAKSTLHDFSGVTSSVEGELTVNLAHPGDRPAGTITAEAATLDTGLAGRDEDMRQTLAVDRYPTILFEWTGFVASTVDPEARTITGTATGELTIRGQTREVSMLVRVSVDASKRVIIDGETSIRLSDFGVSPPTRLGGTVKVDDELELWIALSARLLGAAKEDE